MTGRNNNNKNLRRYKLKISHLQQPKEGGTQRDLKTPDKNFLLRQVSEHGITARVGAGLYPRLSRLTRGQGRRLQHGKRSHRPGAKMKSRAWRSAAATLGCHKSTMKTTRGPSSAEPSWNAVCRKESSKRRQRPSAQHWGSPPTTSSQPPGVLRPKWHRMRMLVGP